MSTQEQRERFEAFAKRRDMSIERISCGRYKSSYTQAMFESWQAAEAAAIERCAKVCRELVDALSKESPPLASPTHKQAAGARMCVSAIRALLTSEKEKS